MMSENDDDIVFVTAFPETPPQKLIKLIFSRLAFLLRSSDDQNERKEAQIRDDANATPPRSSASSSSSSSEEREKERELGLMRFLWMRVFVMMSKSHKTTNERERERKKANKKVKKKQMETLASKGTRTDNW